MLAHCRHSALSYTQILGPSRTAADVRQPYGGVSTIGRDRTVCPSCRPQSMRTFCAPFKAPGKSGSHALVRGIGAFTRGPVPRRRRNHKRTPRSPAHELWQTPGAIARGRGYGERQPDRPSGNWPPHWKPSWSAIGGERFQAKPDRGPPGSGTGFRGRCVADGTASGRRQVSQADPLKEFPTWDLPLSVGALRRTYEVSANSDRIGSQLRLTMMGPLEQALARLECWRIGRFEPQTGYL